MRVVSWNVAFRSTPTAERQGALLYELEPDLVLLQEVNPDSAEVLCRAAGADWIVRAIDLRAACPMTGRCGLAELRSQGAAHHLAMPGCSPVRRCPSARYL